MKLIHKYQQYCDNFIAENERIDLINVCGDCCLDNAMLSADRLTAINGYLQLKIYNSNGKWRYYYGF